MINLKDRAKKYYLLADQYLETTKLLLNTIIENDNANYEIGCNEQEALKDMEESIIKSDVYLFIPSMFSSLQTVELFIKGLLLFNEREVTHKHEVNGMINELREIYGDNSDMFETINKFYKNQMEILKKFKKVNNITTTADLYESLRYPENNKKEYEYFELKYNGKEVIKQYIKMLETLEKIKKEILKEYRKAN